MKSLSEIVAVHVPRAIELEQDISLVHNTYSDITTKELSICERFTTTVRQSYRYAETDDLGVCATGPLYITPEYLLMSDEEAVMKRGYEHSTNIDALYWWVMRALTNQNYRRFFLDCPKSIM